MQGLAFEAPAGSLSDPPAHREPFSSLSMPVTLSGLRLSASAQQRQPAFSCALPPVLDSPARSIRERLLSYRERKTLDTLGISVKYLMLLGLQMKISCGFKGVRDVKQHPAQCSSPGTPDRFDMAVILHAVNAERKPGIA